MNLRDAVKGITEQDSEMLAELFEKEPHKTFGMTPQEKAKELIDKFDNVDFIISYVPKQSSKQCASIAVDEIMKMVGMVAINGRGQFLHYWQKVKEEIEKL